MEKAREAYAEDKDGISLRYAEKAIDADTNFILPWILRGDILTDQGRYGRAAVSYRKAMAIDPEFDPFLNLMLGNVTMKQQDYGAAVRHYKNYLEMAQVHPSERKAVEKRINTCLFRKRTMDKPLEIHPRPLDSRINTDDDEYVNSLSTDGERIIFTRKEPVPGKDGVYREQVYLCPLRDSSGASPRGLDPFLNEFGNVGAATFSPDGQYIFFTACHAAGSYGSCDLYYSRKTGARWSMPVNLGPVVNTSTWDSQPCLSSDGTTLYFSSRRPGGYGSSDLWTSRRQSDGTWSRPVNLGPLVNSSGPEMAPFIHQDGVTLYFSSGGHTGMGGYDLFLSRKQEDGTWSTPENIGYPVNTHADEINLIVSPSGKTAYISSSKFSEAGTYDIFYFELPEHLRPLPVTYLAGRVFDSKTGQSLEARFELMDLGSGRTVVESLSDPGTGEFLVCLPSGNRYALNVNKHGYLFYSAHFDLVSGTLRTRPYRMDIPLVPIEKNQKMVLRNIFFETDEYALKEESLTELERALRFLKENPGLKIEIGGHTDSIGSAAYNKDLSMRRARSVYAYFVRNGIEPDRLHYTGYGYGDPYASNETEKGRALNRRTELKIIDVD